MISYEDGDTDELNMACEEWKHDSIGIIFGNDKELTLGTELQSFEKNDTEKYYNRFKHKDFHVNMQKSYLSLS